MTLPYPWALGDRICCLESTGGIAGSRYAHGEFDLPHLRYAVSDQVRRGTIDAWHEHARWTTSDVATGALSDADADGRRHSHRPRGHSRLPASDALGGIHVMASDWMLIVQGYIWNNWTGKRGAREAFVPSMAKLGAARQLAFGANLMLHLMLSTDPPTGKRGYPDLFASGETAHGIALVDRQHPHHLFMKMSARIDVAAGADGKLVVYGALADRARA